MKLASSAFQNYEEIPQEYTCDGDGVHPPLFIAEVPQEAKSLVLIVDDPDAPGGTFVHWIMWNISPNTEEIDEGKIPAGAIQGVNSAGENGWVAPCPPSGTHHYRFLLSALSTTLDLPSSVERDGLEKAMEGLMLDRAELVGTYTKTIVL